MAGNPVDEFLQVKESAAQQRRDLEQQQLQTWKRTRDPEHLAPLLKAYEPLINQKLRAFKAPAVNKAGFHAELQKHLIKAFETYDPSKGAALATHAENYLKKSQRYNTRFQNLAYIPEGKTKYIGKIMKAQDELAEDFGRPATHTEIADHLGLQPKLVTKIIEAQRKDIPASSFASDPTEVAMHRDQEVINLLPYNLTPEENQVFNHIFGHNGAQRIDSTNDIAKKLGKSPSQISRLRTSILAQYRKYK